MVNKAECFIAELYNNYILGSCSQVITRHCPGPSQCVPGHWMGIRRKAYVELSWKTLERPWHVWDNGWKYQLCIQNYMSSRQL